MAFTHSHRCDCGATHTVCTEQLPGIAYTSPDRKAEASTGGYVRYTCPVCKKDYDYAPEGVSEDLGGLPCPEGSVKGVVR